MKKKISTKVEVEAERILSSPQPLAEIKKHLDNIIAGEEANKQLIFLLLLSGKVNEPRRKQMILLKGRAGVGKTTLMNVADFFKTKTIGRLSETALDYIEGFSEYEVLKLQELAHMDYDRPLKFVSADDGGYNIEVTIPSRQEDTSSPGAPFRTFTGHVPAITLITSTTRLTIEPQFRRRSWIINLDESEEQTEKVRLSKIKREEEEVRLKLGLIPETSYSRSKRILKAVVEKVKPCRVIIPFRDQLTRLLPKHKLEVRGHYDKLLTLPYLYGVLLQDQLPKINGTPILTAERALEALDVSRESFEVMTSMDSRIINLLEVLSEEGYEEGDQINREERIKLANKIKRTPRTVLEHLNALDREEYLKVYLMGREKIFELLAPPEKIATRFGSLTSILTKHREALKLFMNAEAQEDLTKLCDEKGVEEEKKKELLSCFPL